MRTDFQRGWYSSPGQHGVSRMWPTALDTMYEGYGMTYEGRRFENVLAVGWITQR